MRMAAFVFALAWASVSQAQVQGMIWLNNPYYIPPGAYGAVNYPSTGYVNQSTPRVSVQIFNNQGGRIGFFAVRDARSQQAFAKNLNAWLDEHKMVVDKCEQDAEGIRITVKPGDPLPEGDFVPRQESPGQAMKARNAYKP